MWKPPRLNDHAAHAIRELQGRYGIEPTLEESIWLHGLGEQFDSPPGYDDRHLIGRPVKCGNAVLWPFTIGAAIWWRTRGSVWFTGASLPGWLSWLPVPASMREHPLEAFALGFCLAHARAPAMLRDVCVDYASTVAEVRRWVEGLGCGARELNNAFGRLTGPEALTPPSLRRIVRPAKADEGLPQDTAEWTKTVAELHVAFGGDLDFWTWNVEQDAAIHMLADARAVDRARAASVHGAAYLEPPDRNDPATRAHFNLRLAIVHIAKSRGYTFGDDWIPQAPAGWVSEVKAQ